MDHWPHVAGYPGLSTLALPAEGHLCPNYKPQNQMFIGTSQLIESVFLARSLTVFSWRVVFRLGQCFRSASAA